ncbi:hypothetical protein N657DRAFT_677707 [Parathielavia appendiculata]|uniref:Uncharacterized protein n=1 Tax=Parathielavia appendiculata TaxID=2587402 RepID=A0AAN6U8J4_9PEZI|nr:hypothetical protein N657DRAFT_677707 [Parathielavia appendiculata]
MSEARNAVQPGRISGTGVYATSGDLTAPEPSVTSMASPGNESQASLITLHAGQDRPVLVFPIPDASPVCVRWSRVPVDSCPKHSNGPTFCRRFLKAKADDKGNNGDEPKPADDGLPLPPLNSQLEEDHHPTNEMCPATPPQVVQSWTRTPTLPDD